MEAKRESKITMLRERGSRIWIDRGIAHLDFEAYEKALDAFTRAYELDPESIDAIQYLAQELYLQGKPDESEALLRRALESKPDVTLYRTLCAVLLDDPKRLEETTAIINEVRGLEGGTIAAILLEGHYEIEKNKGERALYLFQSALDSEPANQEAKEGVARALNLIGIELSENDRNDEAIFTFKRAIEFDSLWSAPQVNLGNCFCNIGDIERARAAYSRGIELEMDNPQAHFNLGRLLSDEEDYEAAEFEFLQILDIEPTYPDAHFEIGRIYSMRSDFESAIFHYEQEIQSNPTSIPCLCNLAISYISVGRPEEGETTLKSALEIEEDPFTLYTLAGLYATLERNDDSISMIERAAALKPNWLAEYLISDDKFDRIRDIPRFAAAIASLAVSAS
ncbi:MAG: tetratricopeptide repeat protein [bacterium]